MELHVPQSLFAGVLKEQVFGWQVCVEVNWPSSHRV